LKKQGILFSNPDDYEKIDPADKVSIIGLTNIQLRDSLTLRLHKQQEGVIVDIPLSHLFNEGSKYFM
jgi:aconitate hydratase